MGPIGGFFDQPVFYRIEPTNFHMFAGIPLAPNVRLPIPPLPHPARLAGHMAWPHMAPGQRAGKARLEIAAAARYLASNQVKTYWKPDENHIPAAPCL